MALDLPPLGIADEDIAAFQYMLDGMGTKNPIVALNKCLKLGFEAVKARAIRLAKETGEPLDEATLPTRAPVLRLVGSHDNVTPITAGSRILENRPKVEVHIRTLEKVG